MRAAALLLLMVSVTARAEEANPLARAEETAAFAHHLSETGDDYRAIGEYKRALFLAPQAPAAPNWALAIGDAYLHGDQPEAAATAFEHAGDAYPSVRAAALLGAAQSYRAARHFTEAISRAVELTQLPTASAEQVRSAHYVEGWALLGLHRDDDAAQAFAAARGEGVAGQRASLVLAELPRLEHIPYRSPALAGVLGVIPGFGHLYVGDVPAAASALVWNGVFGWAVVEAVLEKRWSLVAVLGLFEAMWYGGSIVGAVSGAERFNRDARVNALEDLANHAPPFLSNGTMPANH